MYDYYITGKTSIKKVKQLINQIDTKMDALESKHRYIYAQKDGFFKNELISFVLMFIAFIFSILSFIIIDKCIYFNNWIIDLIISMIFGCTVFFIIFGIGLLLPILICGGQKDVSIYNTLCKLRKDLTETKTPIFVSNEIQCSNMEKGKDYLIIKDNFYGTSIHFKDGEDYEKFLIINPIIITDDIIDFRYYDNIATNIEEALNNI